MKRTITYAVLFISLLMMVSCHSKAKKTEDNMAVNTSNAIVVYYFHNTRRCATCKAVEKVSKEAVTEYYGNKVIFKSMNLEEKVGKIQAKELRISGQTLLIVSGDYRCNLTNEAFINARNNPDKLKALIKKNIDTLVN